MLYYLLLLLLLTRSHLIKTLPAELTEQPAVALKCRLSGALSPTKELNKIFTDIVIPDGMLSAPFVVKCVAMNVYPEVSLIDADGVTLHQFLKKLSPLIVAVPTPSSVVVKPKISNRPAISDSCDSSSAVLPSRQEVLCSLNPS